MKNFQITNPFSSSSLFKSFHSNICLYYICIFLKNKFFIYVTKYSKVIPTYRYNFNLALLHYAANATLGYITVRKIETTHANKINYF